MARACGGFFCSSPTQPIAQGGEKIVFALDTDGSITAVVQITYSGPADTFAWVLPVPSVPTVSVGTSALVQGLDQATMPSFMRTPPRFEGTCVEPHCSYPSSGSAGCCFGASATGRRGYTDAAAIALDAASSDGGPGADSGITVLARAEVGPYNYVVFTGPTSMAIHDWLVTNGYLVPATTVPLLDPYVAQHSNFIAVKLSKGATPPGELPSVVGDLAPLVLHYASGEPCIPIRLTALATIPDMPITAFFLADADVRPDNYLETELPDDPTLWTVGGTGTYDTVLSRAADDAGGHAWIREYTGRVPSVTIPAPDVSALASDTDPRAFMAQLTRTGLALDEQMLALLSDALPPPAGVAADAFFSCLASLCATYDAYLRTVPFDPVATEARIDTEVVGPRRDAMRMLTTHTRLTRLATTMSADEMTLDPTFAVAATAHDVSNVHTATTVTKCSAAYLSYQAPVVLRMPSGAEATLTAGTPYPGDAAFCPRYGGRAAGGCAIGSPAPPVAPFVVAFVVLAGAWRLQRRLSAKRRS